MDWIELRELIVLNNKQFSEEQISKIFDEATYDELKLFTYVVLRHTNLDRNKGLTFIDETKSICKTITDKERITYKQFRALLFFMMKSLSRLKNPIKDGSEKND